MGGAGGHMWHPLDCPDVNSGQDLIDFFKKSIEAIKRNPSVKFSETADPVIQVSISSEKIIKDIEVIVDASLKYPWRSKAWRDELKSKGVIEPSVLDEPAPFAFQFQDAKVKPLPLLPATLPNEPAEVVQLGASETFKASAADITEFPSGFSIRTL